jgi:hypothetical protein
LGCPSGHFLSSLGMGEKRARRRECRSGLPARQSFIKFRPFAIEPQMSGKYAMPTYRDEEKTRLEGFAGRAQTHPRPLPCHLLARDAQAGGGEERRLLPLIRGGLGRGLTAVLRSKACLPTRGAQAGNVGAICDRPPVCAPAQTDGRTQFAPTSKCNARRRDDARRSVRFSHVSPFTFHISLRCGPYPDAPRPRRSDQGPGANRVESE